MASPNLSLEETRERIFSRLWGIALVAHVVGNWLQPDLPEPVAWANLAVGFSGLLLVVAPTRRLLIVASGLVLVSVLLEMPVTGNHWIVAGLVSLAILLTRGDPQDFVAPARLILLIFYAFAAFAKLNTGFFDPSVSCAVFYANQWLDGYGLGPLATGSIVAEAAIWGSALIELSVPLMLVWRRTRTLGLIAGSLFHGLISLDLNQHFYDFTAVLLPLFLLFAPARMWDRIEELRMIPVRARRWAARGLLVVGGAMVIAACLPLTPTTSALLSTIPFVIWTPFVITWLVVLVRTVSAGERLRWAVSPLVALVVALAFVNGLTPYLELKTAYGFNMYANLVMADGESNHVVIRRTLPLREGNSDPVSIVNSSDPGLAAYRDAEYLIPYPEFRRYLSTRPEVSVDYVRGDVSYTVSRAGDRPVLTESIPWWWRFLPLRAIDTQRPPRCQDVFLSAL